MCVLNLRGSQVKKINQRKHLVPVKHFYNTFIFFSDYCVISSGFCKKFEKKSDTFV